MARELAEVVDFGRYEPLFRIGIGGMAEVYAARIRGEAGFQKLVAVKRMLPHLGGDPKFVDMFLDEARLAANISSPNVVGTLDLGRADDDSLYLVMELILGVTLSQMLRHMAEQRKYIDLPVCIELVAQAAQGLDDAHEARAPNGEPMHLVHRDVSPQNILIGVDGRARVTNFGIAHALLLRRTETQVGEMKGKFAYFSPEQAFGKTIDRRSDVFALGVVAWELVTGRRLFKGTPMEQLKGVKSAVITPPHLIRADVPKEISDVLMKALARDESQRLQTATAFASALRRAAMGLGDPPASRAIGLFVSEVGGERLARMQDCIAGSQTLPSDVGRATAIIDGGGPGTEVLSESEHAESTFLLGDNDLDPELDRWSLPYGVDDGGATVADAHAVDELAQPSDAASDAAMRPVPGGIAELPTRTLTPASQGDHAAVIAAVERSLEQAATSEWLVAPPLPLAPAAPHPKRPNWRLIGASVGAVVIVGISLAIALAIGSEDPEPMAPNVTRTATERAERVPADPRRTVEPASAGEDTPTMAGEPEGSSQSPSAGTNEEESDESEESEELGPREGARSTRPHHVGMRASMSATTIASPSEQPAMTSPNPLPVWPGNR